MIGRDPQTGRLLKGHQFGQATRFKPGQHWRPRKPIWDKSWMEAEYVGKQRSAGDIAKEIGVTDAAVIHWLRKHRITRRSISAARKVKRWGASGPANPMYGKRGSQCPSWRGGLTPFRQAVYATAEWRRAVRVVRKRDVVCQLCGHANKPDLDLHHILPFSDAPLLACDPGNLILLCKKCHRKIQRRERRWAKRLLEILKGKGGQTA